MYELQYLTSLMNSQTTKKSTFDSTTHPTPFFYDQQLIPYPPLSSPQHISRPVYHHKQHWNTIVRSEKGPTQSGNIQQSFRERRSFDIEQSEVMKVEDEDVERKSFKNLKPVYQQVSQLDKICLKKQQVDYGFKYNREQLDQSLNLVLEVARSVYLYQIKSCFDQLVKFGKRKPYALQVGCILEDQLSRTKQLPICILATQSGAEQAVKRQSQHMRSNIMGIHRSQCHKQSEMRSQTKKKEYLPQQLSSSPKIQQIKCELSITSNFSEKQYLNPSRIRRSLIESPIILLLDQQKHPNSIYHLIPDHLVDATSDISLNLSPSIDMKIFNEKIGVSLECGVGEKNSKQQKSTTDFLHSLPHITDKTEYPSSKNNQFIFSQDLKNLRKPRLTIQPSVKYQENQYFTAVKDNPTNKIKSGLAHSKPICIRERPKSLTTVNFSYTSSMQNKPKILLPSHHQIKISSSITQQALKRPHSHSQSHYNLHTYFQRNPSHHPQNDGSSFHIHHQPTHKPIINGIPQSNKINSISSSDYYRPSHWNHEHRKKLKPSQQYFAYGRLH